jgi:hypothetical protein
MADDDRRLRETYVALAAPPPGDVHPSDVVWEQLALHELPAVERERVMDHVVRCAACAAIYRGLRELESEARNFDSGVPKPIASAGPRILATPWLAGLAAAAMLVIALLVPWHPHSPEPTSPIRSTEQPLPIVLAPLGEVSGAPPAFVWQAFAGAERYRVELSSGDGTVAWSSEPSADTQLPWPASVKAAPGVYYWRVVALPGSDRRLLAEVSSKLMTFTILPASADSVPKTR